MYKRQRLLFLDNDAVWLVEITTMATEDDNDLTDRYDELTGDTLEDQWEENPDPPTRYGLPGPRTIMDEGEYTTYAWSWNEEDDEIAFDGELASVIQ